jgi:cyclophilin family peptidyl-prolyl cis-trans isomerase
MPSGDPVPALTNKITSKVEISFAIGRTDSGTIQLGLYGEDVPLSVAQFLTFVTKGLVTTSEFDIENGMGVQSVPVSIGRGGILGEIVPNQRLDFGIPSQALAYARSLGISKAGDGFLAQPRPKPLSEPFPRTHDVAGLLSVAGKGIGYGGSTFESDDECFDSSFQITSSAVPAMDNKEGRRVIGQVLDEQSMAFLARLASLPPRKGFKGVIPGQNAGPPLLSVKITNVLVSSGSSYE